MNKLAIFLVFLTYGLSFATVASAAVPNCVLGGPTAMDTNRQLVEGEVFEKTTGPLVVNLRFKPTAQHPEHVGECMLPSGTEVATKNGLLMWVRSCGNDEVNHNVVVNPKIFRTSMEGLRGYPGPQGPEGPQGPQGLDGKDFVPQRRPLCGESWKTGRRWACTAVAVIVVGTAATSSGGGGGDNNPSRGDGNTIP